MNVYRPLTLLNTLTATTLLTLGILGSAGSVRAATFGFSLGELPGSGTLEVNDSSLTGADYEIIKGADLQGGALSWKILIGQAESYTNQYYDEEPYFSDFYLALYRNYPEYWNADNFDNFQQADFIFERGMLTGIQNYSWYGYRAGGRGDSLEGWLNLGVESSTSASLSVEGSLVGTEGYTDVSIARSNLPIRYFTIEPWKNPNSHNVPEPSSLLASGLALGSFLLKKKMDR